jgi:valyl-tRNA synthetase
MAVSFALAPRFEPGSIEHKLYDSWTAKGLFTAHRDIRKKPYTIMIPPPNVTGQLHLGHALNNTLQDVMIRFKKMRGFNTLWLPGTDHAGIATQAVVERKIYEEEKKTREQLGREEFVGRIWKWKEQYGSRILEQLRALGCGCDWTRTRFTLDDGLSRAVRVAFVEMYDRGLIYRGARIVNWDCTLQTAVSDDEIEMVSEKGILAHIKYPVKGEPGVFVEVATTRPETMFGDVAVAVNPGDERWRGMIGKLLALPLAGRDIPVIADPGVEMGFGTGAVKVTPGHDPADFERGQKNRLETMVVFNKDGTLNHHCGKYAGLQRDKARKQVLADLEALGLLTKTEDYEHNVPQSDRSKTIIEPLVSEQWFVKMSEIAGPAIAVAKEGKLRFTPERWSRVYLQWLENVQDWCISRQLWWGHRIPVYYDADGNAAASADPITTHPKTGKPIVRQDDDVLDTWFSSALWPFSTLGWPDESADLEAFYPTDALFTARDIIYLWVARMVIQGFLFTGKQPFEDVFIHPTILDERGKRMSKSAGNGIDPVDMIRIYGVDSFRFSLAGLATDNQDCRLSIEREKPAAGEKYGRATGVKQFETGRNFVNKVWNASRFALGNLTEFDSVMADLPTSARARVTALEAVAIEDRWILSRMNRTVKSVGAAIEGFRFHEATQEVYHFIWDDFCDWYLEVIKPRLYDGKGGAQSRAMAQAVLVRVLDASLKLLHPFAPFVSEEIWLALRPLLKLLDGSDPADSILLAGWPETDEARVDSAVEAEFAAMQELIRGLRAIRADHEIPKKTGIPVTVSFPDAASLAAFDDWHRAIVGNLAGATGIDAGVKLARPKLASTVVIGSLEAFVPLAEMIDPEMEKKRVEVKIEKLKNRIHGMKSKLENAGYIERAPVELVEETRGMLSRDVDELSRLERIWEELKV